MTNVQGPGGLPAVSPSRTLTAPAPGPAAAQPGAIVLPQDALRTQSAPKDPAMLANLAIMSLDLASPDPAKVQQALGLLQGTFGPAYRQEVLQAIAGQIRPGMPPETAAVLGQALVLNQASGALPQVQAALQADPRLAAALGPVQQALGGQVQGSGATPAPLGPPVAQPPGQPLPGQAVAPVAPAAARPAAVPGISQEQAMALAKRLADHFESVNAAVEIAKLPTDQAAAVMRLALAEPTIVLSSGRCDGINVVSKAMALRVPEPGAMEIMRGIIDLPRAGNGGSLDQARSRAAFALLHHGNPNQDLPSVMKLLIGQYSLSPDYRDLVLRSLANKPAWVSHEVALRSLGAMANDPMLFDLRLGACFALSKSQHPYAKDAIGTSLSLRDPNQPAERKRFVLEYLKATTGPLSAQVKAVLNELAKHSDPGVASLAKELLKRT